MPGAATKPIVLAALAATVLLALAVAAPASGGSLQPRGDRVFFGVSDTGNSADFGHFSTSLHKHPALIESFRSLGLGLPGLDRALAGGAGAADPPHHDRRRRRRPRADHPRAIAQGYGDEYLIRLNKLFWAKKMRAYIRPLGEPNRCLNVYAAYDCAGNLRDAAHSPYWYKQAFRRIYILLHGGGKRREDRRPPRERRPAAADAPDAPAACRRRRSRSSGAPCPPARRPCPRTGPRHFYPGDDYVDWVGTDFYSDNQDWKALTGLYNRFPRKPFALPEWGVSSGDDPSLRQAPAGLGASATSAARCSSTTRTSARRAPTGSRTTRPASACSTGRSTRRASPPSRRTRRRRRHRRREGWRRSLRGCIEPGDGSSSRPTWSALAGIVVLGAALRFATLDLQSYRYDEAVTVARVLHPSLFDTLSTVPTQRVDPSPVLPGGLALVAPVRNRRGGAALALGAGGHRIDRRRLPGRDRAAATAPGRADRRGDGRRQPGADLVLPGRPRLRAGLPARRLLLPLLRPGAAQRRAAGPRLVGSVLGVGDRHPLLRGFVVVPEAALLLLGAGERRRAGLAIAAVAAVAALLLPIALHQDGNAHAGWIAEQPLSQRLERAGAKLVGDDNGDEHGVRQPGRSRWHPGRNRNRRPDAVAVAWRGA